MFEPRVALASLSGESDAEWARVGSEFAGAAFLGGVALDEKSRAAARKLVERDREEFLPEDPLSFVAAELDALGDEPVRPAVNVRSATLPPVREAARLCADRDAILEVNAHCRQAELCAVGCGETLLRDTDRLAEYVAAAAEAGATVSVKVRAEVEGVDLGETARSVASAGAEAIHVDAMDSEAVVRDVTEAAPDLFVVANNEVRDGESVREYLDYGADAVSVGRPSTDPRVLRRVREAVDEWFAESNAERPSADESNADGVAK
ncbi:tRNA-dihydrouridine synthase [Halopelagius longus]|uniref:Dihydropyrimidine dehydrogenase n=1 Tax=Halopelagius longus TaxID=1236180 RepID=A0A1H0YVB8_9EURY|nr:tRNA-dihydrouridine synthase [Halopelagius longus]RDI72696.1 dihydropyrimidine dehydrogenase [Halopelagius longus]SDQ19129.1 TIM-barrel protein, putative [Halopelagius longus]